ncbi:MAG TPA: hypothetical protein VGM94_09940 [Galbitalea sp.]|jgi:hypothetical protein
MSVMLGVLAVALAVGGCSAPASTSVNGRTLLTYPSTGVSADALAFGILGSNQKGCVTIGRSVLVVPDGSTLATDGSIRVNGKTYRVGTTIHLGGGGGEKPPHSHCGVGQQYFWV